MKKTHPVVDGVSLDFATLGTLRATCAKAPLGPAVASCFRGGLPPVDFLSTYFFLAVVLVLAIFIRSSYFSPR